jgi:hypothetical protein
MCRPVTWIWVLYSADNTNTRRLPSCLAGRSRQATLLCIAVVLRPSADVHGTFLLKYLRRRFISAWSRPRTAACTCAGPKLGRAASAAQLSTVQLQHRGIRSVLL